MEKKLQSIRWSVTSQINHTPLFTSIRTTTFDLWLSRTVSAPGHTNTHLSTRTIPVPWSPLEPRILKHSSIWFIIKEYEVYDELSLFYILQLDEEKRFKPTYRKVETNKKRFFKKREKTGKETKWEVRGQFTAGIPKITLFSLASSFPLYHVKNFSLCPIWSSSFVFFGCVAVKLSVCSPCGDNIKKRSSTVSQRTPQAVTQAVFPHTNHIYAFNKIPTFLFCLIIRRHKGMCLSRESKPNYIFFFYWKLL